ncbi:hypothetical protein [Streptosporangium amethystogenes]|uniref:hypothetical protein n=1 Tax=Streptosporangium amethystogenes TaxID=2002 RepID=UPI0004C75C80|nr:hypothetical protein [Streptosporangium amethystogenes]
MTVIGILLPVVGLLVGVGLTLADPVLLSRITGERAEGAAEGGAERLSVPLGGGCAEGVAGAVVRAS